MYTKHSLAHRYSWYGWLVCSLATLFYCYEYLLRIEPSVMTVELRHHFLGLTGGGLGLLTSMYYVAYAPMQIVVGVMTDRFGPKRVLTFAIILCVFGTYLFGSTSDIYIAAVGRFLVGVGSAFAFVGVLKLAAMWLPEKYFALFTGITTALGMLGGMIGDIGMTWMVAHFGWHRVISVSVMTGLVLIPVFYFFVHEKILHETVRHKHHKTFVAYLMGFFRLLANRDVVIAGFIGCLLYLSLSAFAEMWGIAFLTKAMPHDRLIAPSVNAMVFLGWFFGAPLSGWLSGALGTKRLLLIVGSLVGAAIFAFILFHPNLPPLVMGFLLFLFGIFSSVQVLCFAIARDFVTVNLAGTAAGVINMLVMISGMLLQPIMSHMLDWSWGGLIHNGLRVYGINDYRMAMLVIPVAYLVSAILAYTIREKRHTKIGAC